GDTLTVVPLTGAGDELRAQGGLRVVDGLAEADPADIVILAEPLSGDAAEVRSYLDGLAKYLTAGGVLSVAVLALPDGAAGELARQAALYGVGTDLVLRNTPPVRVHR